MGYAMDDVTLTFMFFDESMDESLDLASLTGVLVPLQAYRAVRDEICRLVWDVLEPPPNTVPQPIELHARNLLSELTDRPKVEADRTRLHVLRSAVDIVNKHGLQVHRVCYTNRSRIAAMLKGDQKLYGLNFANIQNGLQELLETTLVLPVMDGVPTHTEGKKVPSIDPVLIRSFAANVRTLHHYRHHELTKHSLDIKHAHNLAEPVFGDSAHATLLQLADLVSYLLLQRDREELQPNVGMSEYKAAVIEISRNFDAGLLNLWRGEMKLKI